MLLVLLVTTSSGVRWCDTRGRSHRRDGGNGRRSRDVDAVHSRKKRYWKTGTVVKPFARHSPDHPALVQGDVTWTYAALAAVVADTAVILKLYDIRPGDRVMIVSENSDAWSFERAIRPFAEKW